MLKYDDVGFRPGQRGLYSFRAQNKAGRLSPVDPGIGRRVTDLNPTRGCSHAVTRATEVAKIKSVNSLFGRCITDEVYYFYSKNVCEDPSRARVERLPAC